MKPTPMNSSAGSTRPKPMRRLSNMLSADGFGAGPDLPTGPRAARERGPYIQSDPMILPCDLVVPAVEPLVAVGDRFGRWNQLEGLCGGLAIGHHVGDLGGQLDIDIHGAIDKV